MMLGATVFPDQIILSCVYVSAGVAAKTSVSAAAVNAMTAGLCLSSEGGSLINPECEGHTGGIVGGGGTACLASQNGVTLGTLFSTVGYFCLSLVSLGSKLQKSR